MPKEAAKDQDSRFSQTESTQSEQPVSPRSNVSRWGDEPIRFDWIAEFRKNWRRPTINFTFTFAIIFFTAFVSVIVYFLVIFFVNLWAGLQAI